MENKKKTERKQKSARGPGIGYGPYRSTSRQPKSHRGRSLTRGAHMSVSSGNCVVTGLRALLVRRPPPPSFAARLERARPQRAMRNPLWAHEPISGNHKRGVVGPLSSLYSVNTQLVPNQTNLHRRRKNREGRVPPHGASLPPRRSRRVLEPW
jgi:hypothetical protein